MPIMPNMPGIQYVAMVPTNTPNNQGIVYTPIPIVNNQMINSNQLVSMLNQQHQFNNTMNQNITNDINN